MKRGIILAALFIISGCCKPDPGDSTEMNTYIRECWDVARRTDSAIIKNDLPNPRETRPVFQ